MRALEKLRAVPRKGREGAFKVCQIGMTGRAMET